ncbi:MAG TPA: general secretion pathway protein GspB, partial [Candidatus Aminicenantes bacterium]|nr:general secretion pathway protein GspB [Candidatus Aminicenantes bacterium]
GIAPIDHSSDLLLRPLDRDTIQPLPRRPLGTPFGASPFSLPAVPATPGDGSTEATPATTFSLQGIVREGGRRVAVINHQPVRTGDTVAGAQVLRIEQDRVVLRCGEQTIELTTTPARDTAAAGGRNTP